MYDLLYNQFAGSNPTYVFNSEEFSNLSVNEQMIVEDILA
jgi:hypothetical protein